MAINSIADDDKSIRNAMAKLYYPRIHRFVFHLMKDNHWNRNPLPKVTHFQCFV